MSGQYTLNIFIFLIIIVFLIFDSSIITFHDKPISDDTGRQIMAPTQSDTLTPTKPRLFLAGDSITMRFPITAPKAWEAYITPSSPINFGIDGDQTWDLLYRLQNAPLSQISPDTCTILIGVNDILNGARPEEVVIRIREIATYLAKQYPESQILLYHIFPAEKHPGEIRDAIDKTNDLLSHQNYPDNVRLINITQQFLNPDKTLNDAILPDQLHLSQHGYEIWGSSIQDAMRS